MPKYATNSTGNFKININILIQRLKTIVIHISTSLRLKSKLISIKLLRPKITRIINRIEFLLKRKK